VELPSSAKKVRLAETTSSAESSAAQRSGEFAAVQMLSPKGDQSVLPEPRLHHKRIEKTPSIRRPIEAEEDRAAGTSTEGDKEEETQDSAIADRSATDAENLGTSQQSVVHVKVKLS